MNSSRSSTAFFRTLILVLFPIAIVALLTLVVLGVGGPTRHEGRSRVESELSAIEAGLESYKADHGDYPAGTNLTGFTRGNNAFLLQALHGTNGVGKIYVEFNKNQTNAAGCLVDPFGSLYGYQYPGDSKRSGTNFFDLWSYGQDRNTTNINLWFKNWASSLF